MANGNDTPTPTNPPEGVELCRKCGVRPVSPTREKVRHHICGPCYEQLPSNRRYRQSEKSKNVRRRYEQTDKGKAVRRRYEQGDKGKATQGRYNMSEKGVLRKGRKYTRSVIVAPPPKGDLVKSHRPYNAALVESWDTWLEEQEYSPNTRKRYLETLRDFALFSRSTRLLEVEPGDVSRFIGRLTARGNAKTTIASALAAIRSFYTYLQDRGLIRMNPARLMRYKGKSNYLPRTLTDAEVTRLLDACRTLYEVALMEFFYATGCRVGELVQVKVE